MFCTHLVNVIDKHWMDGFALKRNIRQNIKIDTDIAIIGKTETDIDFKNFEKLNQSQHRPKKPIST